MNGEIEQVSGIVISARKALFTEQKIDFRKKDYVLSIRFEFLPRRKFLKRAKKAESVNEWFDECKKMRLEDIKFIIPTSVADRYVLGFSNSSRKIITCFWKNDTVTYFEPAWTFDKSRKGWAVVYKESKWKDAPAGKPSFADKTDELKSVLLEIESFADKLDFKEFAEIFRRAHELLRNGLTGDEKIPIDLPDEFRKIYAAVAMADVFGAMGSWNDSPACCASEKGLEKEYDRLSDKLLAELRFALMYVVNECWQ